ncbi:hypothetical protein D3C83_271370 [compost metagenome]
MNAIRNRGRESILLNILDPNREVLPQFVSYNVVLTAGAMVALGIPLYVCAAASTPCSPPPR